LGSMRIIAIVSVMLILSSCASGYKEFKPFSNLSMEGYKVEPVTGDVYRVSYRGGSYIDELHVLEHWYYTAAELALGKGFDGFEVATSNGMKGGEIVTHDRKLGIDSVTVSAAYFEEDIRLVKKPFESDLPKIFDARELKRKLQRFINKKCGPSIAYGICEVANPETYLMPKKKKEALKR